MLSRLSDKTQQFHADFIFSTNRVSDASNIYLFDYWPLLAEVIQCCLTLGKDVLACYESTI